MLPKENIKTTRPRKRPEILDKQGTFRISEALLQDSPEAVKAVMSHMIVTRCEFLYNGQGHCFEYTALSDLFDKVEPGQLIPEYSIEINANNNEIHATRHEAGLSSARIFLNIIDDLDWKPIE